MCRHLQKTHCLFFPFLATYLLHRKNESGVYSKQLLFASSPHLSLLSYFPIFSFALEELNRNREKKEKKNHNAYKQQKFSILKGTSIINTKNKFRAHLTFQKYLSLGPLHHNFPERWHQCWAWSICTSLGQLAGCF